MASKPELNERDAKVVQWLNEAHLKEAELEADLVAHISLTQKPAYKKRLKRHLTETRDHKRKVAARIKKLGGTAEKPAVPVVPGAVGEVAGKAVAAVKGQVGVVRAAVTEQAETHMRNAQEELREEHVEIAIYSRLEALATAVGDEDTAKLAKAIRRDEERMAKYLSAELGRLVRDVVRAEIPSDQRASSRSRSRSRAASNGRQPAAASRSAASARTGAKRRTAGSTPAKRNSTGGSRARAGARG
jgi:ferritin-like metal-binding protein YciE